MSRILDYTGKRFGRLVVVENIAGWGPPTSKRGIRQRLVKCVCDCGQTIITRASHLPNGAVRSCGCLHRDAAALSGANSKTHGESWSPGPTPEYKAWLGMIERCENQKLPAWKDYGGRGIAVCPQWRHDYKAFLAYIGRRPSSKYTLDRYPNNDGNYEPGNVRWATRKQQANNRRVPRRYWRAKLSIDQVVEIQKSKLTIREIEQLFPVKERQIRSIRAGSSWKRELAELEVR